MDHSKSATEFIQAVDIHNGKHVKQALEMMAQELDRLERRVTALEGIATSFDMRFIAFMNAMPPKGLVPALKAAGAAALNSLQRSFQ